MKRQNYVIKKSDVLCGSSLLKRKNDNSDRVSYMVSNIKDNKALNFYINKYPKKDKSFLTKRITKEYIKYRDNWNDQPSKIIGKRIPTKKYRENQRQIETIKEGSILIVYFEYTKKKKCAISKTW